MSTARDGVSFSNIAATTAAFALKGGRYGVAVVATFTAGSVKLQTLGPDGATWLSVASATDFTVAGYGTVDLPPGQYRFTIATATAVYASIVGISD